MPSDSELHQAGVRRREPAGIEVERAEMILEVNMQ
jgi:hypothetical protein